MNFKRSVYLMMSIILSILLGFLAHAFIELAVIWLLMADFKKFGLGLSWDQWFTIHFYGTVILLAAGAVFGIWLGRVGWRIVYVEKRHWRWKSPE